jgi:hypothetical protein
MAKMPNSTPEWIGVLSADPGIDHDPYEKENEMKRFFLKNSSWPSFHSIFLPALANHVVESLPIYTMWLLFTPAGIFLIFSPDGK